MAVTRVLTDAGITPTDVTLGTATLPVTPTPSQLKSLGAALAELGFELIADRRLQLVEQIRTAIIEYVRSEPAAARPRLSDYLCARCPYDYSSLSKLFSETYGSTIEHYCIAQKVERAKELLANGELTVSQIADCLGYSSVAHLSAQFSRQAGMTPSAYRKLKEKPRLPLDKIR